MIRTYLEMELFTIGNLNIRVEHLVGFVLVLIVTLFVYKKIIKVYLPKSFRLLGISKASSADLNVLIRNIIILIACLFLVKLFDLNFRFFSYYTFNPDVILIFKLLLIYQISKLFVWGVDNIIHNFYLNRQSKSKLEKISQEEIEHDHKKETSILTVMRYIIYFFAIITFLSLAGLSTPDFAYHLTIGDDVFSFGISKLLTTVLIILIARLIVWILTQYVLFNIYERKEISFAHRFAINQLILYVVYVIAIFAAFNYLFGDKLAIFWGGAAALLVGVGLGLQQTFNDFFSGLVLLFERSVGAGDIVEIENEIGKVLKIGMRSSLLQTRDLATIVVPNSKMVNLNVLNLSHEFPSTRFEIIVSVAYGSDTRLVEQLLIDSLIGVNKVLKNPPPRVHFRHFGDNGLDFRLFFYTRELFRVEVVKSDIRFNIDKLFREHNITIPFPQRQIWFDKNPSED